MECGVLVQLFQGVAVIRSEQPRRAVAEVGRQAQRWRFSRTDKMGFVRSSGVMLILVACVILMCQST